MWPKTLLKDCQNQNEYDSPFWKILENILLFLQEQCHANHAVIIISVPC